MSVQVDVSAPRARLGLLQVCGAGVLWGTGGLVVTLLNQRDGFGAMTASAWRMLLAATVLVAFVALTGRAQLVGRAWREQPGLVAVIGLGTGAYQGLYFMSVLMVGVSVATVVALGLAPILAGAWEHLRARTRPRPRQLLVLGAALVGLVLISMTSHGQSVGEGDRPLLGILAAVVAGFLYAASTVLGHRVAAQVDAVSLTTCTTSVGAIALAPFLGLALLTGEPVVSKDPVSLALLAYLGIGTMALAYGLLYAGLRTTTGSAATVATLVEPVSAALLAVALLGERLAWPAWVGGGLILLAVVALDAAGDTVTDPRPAMEEAD